MSFIDNSSEYPPHRAWFVNKRKIKYKKIVNGSLKDSLAITSLDISLAITSLDILRRILTHIKQTTFEIIVTKGEIALNEHFSFCHIEINYRGPDSEA